MFFIFIFQNTQLLLKTKNKPTKSRDRLAQRETVRFLITFVFFRGFETSRTPSLFQARSFLFHFCLCFVMYFAQMLDIKALKNVGMISQPPRYRNSAICCCRLPNLCVKGNIARSKRSYEKTNSYILQCNTTTNTATYYNTSLQLNLRQSTKRWLEIGQDEGTVWHNKAPKGDRWEDNRTGKKDKE